ncbi:ion transporter [Ruthenibacterium lactatiformans]|uniref:ion transporter n=1 Tax=Ruthenibacterium lactatiformans TaxID=1550024 RepID=UPI003AF7614A
MFTIIASLVPLTISTTPTWASVLDGITVNIFILDYIFRLCTSDFRLQCGIKSFFIYPLTPMALIDLFSILPSFSILNQAFRMLKILRLFRTFRVFRVFKIARYSRSVEIIVNVLRKQREPLFAVCGLSGAYILISALVIFNVEPQTFDNFLRRYIGQLFRSPLLDMAIFTPLPTSAV